MGEEILSAGDNRKIDACALEIKLTKVAQEDIVAGSPREGATTLGSVSGAEVGVWELRGGTTIDTEVDEIFVVLAGEAKIDFLTAADDLNGGEIAETVTVKAGDVMRLVAGSKTRWEVPNFIRKVYIA